MPPPFLEDFWYIMWKWEVTNVKWFKDSRTIKTKYIYDRIYFKIFISTYGKCCLCTVLSLWVNFDIWPKILNIHCQVSTIISFYKNMCLALKNICFWKKWSLYAITFQVGWKQTIIDILEFLDISFLCVSETVFLINLCCLWVQQWVSHMPVCVFFLVLSITL